MHCHRHHHHHHHLPQKAVEQASRRHKQANETLAWTIQPSCRERYRFNLVVVDVADAVVGAVAVVFVLVALTLLRVINLIIV